MAQNRIENVAPSLAKIYEMKQKLSNAGNASKLLKRKARVFDLLLRDYSHYLVSNTDLVSAVMKKAFIALAKAKYVNGEFSNFVFENIGKKSCVRVTARMEMTLAGSIVFQFVETKESCDPWPLAGLSTGGHQLTETKRLFKEALELLVYQTTLRTVFDKLEKAMISTMRKSMVIEHITRPKILNTIAYIKDQLDDMEREDMYRLKKIKQKIMAKNKKMEVDKYLEEIKSQVIVVKPPHPHLLKTIKMTIIITENVVNDENSIVGKLKYVGIKEIDEAKDVDAKSVEKEENTKPIEPEESDSFEEIRTANGVKYINKGVQTDSDETKNEKVKVKFKFD